MVYLLVIILLAVFFITVFSIFWGRRIRASPRVILLHSLESKSLDISGISFQRFEQLLKLIEEAGLTVGTPAEALRDHTKVAITFDDGYDDLMQLAPLLRKRSIPITVFIPTAYIGKHNDWDHFLVRGRRKHLDDVQIRELAGLGVQFGSHGHRHCDMTSLSEAELRNELEISRRVLCELTGQEVFCLAYPFGRSNQQVREIAAKLGLARQFGSSARSIDGSLIGRIPVTKFDNSFTLDRKLCGGFVAGVEAFKSAIVSRFSHLTPVVRSLP